MIEESSAVERGLRLRVEALLEERKKLIEALELASRLLNNMNWRDGEDHAAFCNGVHSPDGQCEGMHLLSRAMDHIDGTLKEST
jgi:hypothetical protein